MYKISDTTRKNLEKSIGMSLTTFDQMSADEERQWVEAKTGKKLSYGKSRKKGIVGRGNPLLARRKFRTMEDLNRKSERMFGV